MNKEIVTIVIAVTKVISNSRSSRSGNSLYRIFVFYIFLPSSFFVN